MPRFYAIWGGKGHRSGMPSCEAERLGCLRVPYRLASGVAFQTALRKQECGAGWQSVLFPMRENRVFATAAGEGHE